MPEEESGLADRALQFQWIKCPGKCVCAPPILVTVEESNVKLRRRVEAEQRFERRL
jgi:hypothetical protein